MKEFVTWNATLDGAWCDIEVKWPDALFWAISNVPTLESVFNGIHKL